MDCSTSDSSVLLCLLEFVQFMSIKLVVLSNHLILCRLCLLLPSIFPSIRVFSSELALLIRCPKYWSFSFISSPSSEYLGLISFRIDWFDLLAVQGTLKSLLQHHSSKASVLGAQPSLWSNYYMHSWLLKKPKFWLYGPLLARCCLCIFIGSVCHSFPSKEQISF